MSGSTTLCPVCGFLLAPGHKCPDLEQIAKAAAQAETPPGFEIEVAKPYTIADEPYEDTMTGATIVPDVIGEVVGWRVWRVLHPLDPKSIRLQSLGAGGKMHSVLWTPGKVMEAFCAQPHTPPSEKCGCGFYAARTREHLLSMHYHSGFDYDDGTAVLVVGEVAMQGKIIPGTQGWRAQRVRPLRISVLPSRWKVMKPLQAMYPKVEFKLENWLSQKKEGGDAA